MKTINLTVSERFSAVGILNAFKGSLEGLAVILEDIKKVSISPEESEIIGLKIVENKEEGNSYVKWDKSKESLISKDLEFNDATVEYLKNYIKEKSDRNEFDINDTNIVTLNGKLNGEKGS